MNMPVLQRNLHSAPSLAGKVSLVTGSTSGIGLGIARALAGAGSAVILNGFGRPDDIAKVRAESGRDVRRRCLVFGRRHDRSRMRSAR